MALDVPIEEDAHALRAAAREAGAFVIGVVGFSGGWHHNARPDAQQVAFAALEHLFDEVCRAHAAVWCASGATDIGVPALAYQVAAARGLICVGVAAAAARRYRLARLHRLVIVGRRFGDESATFVSACDAFFMIGGGSQSEAEMRMAARMNKPITVVQGLGGFADRLVPGELPTARIVSCDALRAPMEPR